MPTRMTVPMALFGLLVIITAATGYAKLSGLLGITDTFIGFFLVFYWFEFTKADGKKLLPTLAGALLGVALGQVMHEGPRIMGSDNGGFLLFAALVLPIIFCQFVGWIPYIANASTMLIMTVVTIPYVQQHTDFVALYKSVLLAAAYVSALVFIAKRIASHFAARAGRTPGTDGAENSSGRLAMPLD